jgi:hypothetical protein
VTDELVPSLHVEALGRKVVAVLPGGSAEDLQRLTEWAWNLTAPASGDGMGFAAAAAGSSHERRPSPYLGQGDQQRGPVRRYRMPDPVAGDNHDRVFDPRLVSRDAFDRETDRGAEDG